MPRSVSNCVVTPKLQYTIWASSSLTKGLPAKKSIKFLLKVPVQRRGRGENLHTQSRIRSACPTAWPVPVPTIGMGVYATRSSHEADNVSSTVRYIPAAICYSDPPCLQRSQPVDLKYHDLLLFLILIAHRLTPSSYGHVRTNPSAVASCYRLWRCGTQVDIFSYWCGG